MTKDLGIDIKEMLIRQGWKVEESHEMGVIRKKLEDLQRLYVSADQQCIKLAEQLGKAEDKIEKYKERSTLLTAKVEDAKNEKEGWRKKFDDERKITDSLRKKIDELIRPLPRQPNPTLSNSSASSLESNSSYTWKHNRQPTKILKRKIIHKPSIRQITPQKRNGSCNLTPLSARLLNRPKLQQPCILPSKPLVDSTNVKKINQQSNNNRTELPAVRGPGTLAPISASRTFRAMSNLTAFVPSPPKDQVSRPSIHGVKRPQTRYASGADNDQGIIQRARRISPSKLTNNADTRGTSSDSNAIPKPFSSLHRKQ